MSSKVLVKFPRVGLGNRLLIWARGVVFSELNQLPLVTSSWWGFHPGAWMRKESKKRIYWGYFKSSSMVARLLAAKDELLATAVHEPPLEKLPVPKAKVIYVFRDVIVNNDLFGGIREHRSLVKQRLFDMLEPSLKKQLSGFDSPIIAIHIRRGDFKLGNQITSNEFFIDCIHQVRKVAGESWPVTIFTDAAPAEIEEILRVENVHLTPSKPDIVDILLMSQSKLLVLSQSSTFSYWAAFLSDAIVLRPAGDWQQNIRSKSNAASAIEISWQQNDKTCVELLKKAILNKIENMQ